MQETIKSRSHKLLDLKGLNDLIAERARYYREQEALINDLIESGNTQLMGLNHDILLAKQELRNIKTDIRTAAQDKVLLNGDLDQIRTEIQLTVVQTSFIGITPILS